MVYELYFNKALKKKSHLVTSYTHTPLHCVVRSGPRFPKPDLLTLSPSVIGTADFLPLPDMLGTAMSCLWVPAILFLLPGMLSHLISDSSFMIQLTWQPSLPPVHSSIHPGNTQLLGTCHVPGSILGTGEIAKKTVNSLWSWCDLYEPIMIEHLANVQPFLQPLPCGLFYLPTSAVCALPSL
jgi:hypothetical protein